MKKSASILDYSYPFLDPAVWDQDRKLFAFQKDFILRLINTMYETYGLIQPETWVQDIVIIGSLTTSKWLRTSDLDVHIRVNLDAFITSNMPGSTKEQAFEKLDLTRKEFDRAKILAPMTQHPTEFYFESVEFKPSNIALVGVYSLMQDAWLKEPVIFEADLDFEESKKDVVAQAEALAEELDGSLGKIQRDIQRVNELEEVIKAWGHDKQQLFYAKVEAKLAAIEAEILKDLQIKQELVDARHSNQDAMSEIEVKFKWLARFGFFGILSNLKTLLEQTGGTVTTQELPLIEKIISQGTVKEALGRNNSAWISPEGTVFDVKDSHVDWIDRNYKWLQKKYHFVIDNSEGAYDEYDSASICSLLVAEGWSRVGDIQNVTGTGVEVPDLYNVSNAVFDFVLSNLKSPNEKITFEDSEGHYITLVQDEIAQGQKAVNKALQRKRMGTIKEAGQVIDINGVRVFKNPSFAQTKNILNKSKEGFLRYVVDPRNNDLFIWDAYDLEHMDAMRGLGIPANLKNYENYSGSISDSDDINDILVFQNEGKGIQPTSSIKEAFLKEAFEDEPKETDTDICVDFDRTIAQPAKHPAIGEPIEGAKESLAKLKELGYNIIIYSCRGDTEEGLKAVEDWMNANDMPYDSVFSGEKPFFKYLIDDRAIHFDSWDKVMQKVEKSHKTASLAIVADSRFFIDPNGKVYPVNDTHEGWVYDNTKLLQDQYGLWKNHPEELYPEEIDNVDAIIPMMLKDGWARIGDLFDLGKERLYGKGIEIADINNVPSSVFSFVSNFGKDKYFIIEDLRRRYVELSVEELMADGQEAINSHLRSAKLVHAASNWPDAAWIAPDGQIYPASSHDTWVATNGKLLKEKYNFDISKFDQEDMWDVVRLLIRAGWSRLSMSPGGKGYMVEVADLKAVPQVVFDTLINSPVEQFIIEQADSYTHVPLSKDELIEGQKGVNRALQMQRHASIDKIAGSGAYWIDPDGKEHPVSGTHTAWVGRNAEKLNKKFGYNLPLGLKEGHQYTDMLLDLGWVRITPTFGNAQFVIDVKDINNIPSVADNFIAKHFFKYEPQIPIWVGTGKNMVIVYDPFPNIQDEVNKALQQKRMGKAFSKKEITAQTDLIEVGQTEGKKIIVPQDLMDRYIQLTNLITSSQDRNRIIEWDNERAHLHYQLTDFAIKYSNFSDNYDTRVNVRGIIHGFAESNLPPEKISNLKQAKTKKVKQGDYSCLMALVPHDLAQEIVAWGVRNVPDEDLYLDEDGNLGRELESHITIKYGLLTNDAKHVRRSFNDDKPFHAKLGKVRHFQPPELPFDVLTVEIISEDLQKANAKICDSFDCAEGLVSDEYKPHITIAYMKRDKAHEYVGYEGFKDKEVELDTVIFSPHKGNRTYFSVSNDKESAFILEKLDKKSYTYKIGDKVRDISNGKTGIIKEIIGKEVVLEEVL